MRYKILTVFLLIAYGALADINITNVPVAGGITTSDKMLGLTNTTHTALISVKQVTDLIENDLLTQSNTYNGKFVGDGSSLTNIPIANVTTPGQIITNGNSTATTLSNSLTLQSAGSLTVSSGQIVLSNTLQRIVDAAETTSGFGFSGGDPAINKGSLKVADFDGGGLNLAGHLKPTSSGAYDLGTPTIFYRNLYLTGCASNNLTVAGTLTATNGVVVKLKTSFTTNFTCTTNLQFYCCNGTNQVVTLPNAANVPNVLYRFSMTNGYARVILTNATGAQTIRDGSSLSLTLIGIQEATLISDGAHWWNAGKIKTVFPVAQFSCTTNIPMTLASTAYPVTFNSTDFDFSQGIVLAAGTNVNGFASKMWITNSGIYEFAPSIVVNFGGNNTVTIWFRKDDVNIPNSATAIKGAAGGSIRCVTIPFVVTVTNSAAYEIWTLSTSTGDSLSFQAAGGVAPNDFPLSPSVICPVKRLSDAWP